MAYTKPVLLPRCEHCGHVWLPESLANALKANMRVYDPPTWCAKCKSPNWNKTPKKRGRPPVKK